MNEPTTGMRNYIPTDTDVRNRYGMGVWWELNDSSGDARAEFDRWLADTKAKQDKATTERIIALLEANVGHSMDRYRYWSEAFELIKGENNE